MNRENFIYIAGPYSGGDVVANVRAAMEAATRLMDAGYQVFCPHLSHFLHLHAPRPYDHWMAHDLAWIRRCDALVKLPGDSPGAEREVAYAMNLGIPCYLGVETFLGPR